MEQILTLDEKKYLKRTCNYFGSLGMTEGEIGVEIESDQYELTINDFNWEYITHFENNHRAEIPEVIIPILQKIINYVIDEGKYQEPDVDYMNYQRIDIIIDCDSKDISVLHWYTFYGREGENSVEFDSYEDTEKFDRWMEEDLGDVEIPNSGILTLRYNGGGDSGYIESQFDETNDVVPAGLEDWCYRQLEKHFGGWEVNEGSDGRFVFNFNNSTVSLFNTYNNEETVTNTLFKENFSS